MLINLTPNLEEIERRKLVAKEHGFDYIPQNDSAWQQYGIGIYQCSFGHNFGHEEFLEFKDKCNVSFDQSFNYFKKFEKSQYGVADSIEQIKEYYKEEIENKDNNFIITVSPVWQDKENKGKGGGWRWHKWGKYIGKLNPQHEYLDDEDFGDNFQYIICFHLIHII